MITKEQLREAIQVYASRKTEYGRLREQRGIGGKNLHNSYVAMAQVLYIEASDALDEMIEELFNKEKLT